MLKIEGDPEIRIGLRPGPDTTVDIVSFISSTGGNEIVIENDLRYQPENLQVVATELGLKVSGKPDFTVMKFSEPGSAAAVFTQNRCAASCVIRSRSCMQVPQIQAIAVNSGNANVFTPTSEHDLNQVVELVSEEFSVEQDHLLFSSTGVIGVPLPVDKFSAGIPGLSRSLKADNLDAASNAILTTDLGPKTASVRLGDVVLCGIAKGAGMIEPNMATMLVYFFTDAAVPADKLQAWLTEAVNESFNCISVDADTSTSDSVMLLASGECEIDEAQQHDLRAAIKAMAVKLARDIVSQGEGAFKTLEVSVRADTSLQYARTVARSIVNSPLVKAAIHGADPNWGRIVMAIGKAEMGLDATLIDPRKLLIKIQGQIVFKNCSEVELNLLKLERAMKADKSIQIEVVIGKGAYCAHAWGCDLSAEYVRINADYTT